jgi:hypothetical protein
VTIIDALDDPAVFAPHFGPAWGSWRIFLKAVFGLPLDPEEQPLFTACTARSVPPSAAVRECWCVAGRRAGKSRVASLVAVFLGCFRDYGDVLAAGEVATLPVIASDRRQARTCMSYISGLLDEVPMLAAMVGGRTADSIELSTGVRIEVHTASWRALRGYSIAACIADELCFWHSEDSANPDREIIAAIRPAMVTIPGSMLIAISSPYSRHGIMWDMHRRHHGDQGDPGILTWQAATRVMNGTVPESVIAEALAADEAAARAEWLAEWRRDIESYVSREVVDACVAPGRQSLPPQGDATYVGFVDPSGGAADSFVLAIAHGEAAGDGTVAVLDVVEEVRAPCSPAAAVRDFARTLRRYRCAAVTGDRYGGEFPRELFAKEGITYVPSEKPKSDLYRELLPAITSGRVRLLDLPRLFTQLLQLERRTARSGRDSIDHAPGGHDDVCNAAAGALTLAATRATGDGEVLAANVAPEPRRRVLDDREFALQLRDRD